MKCGLFWALFSLSLASTYALAQEAAVPQAVPDITQIQINQPFLSEQLGALILPFMWDVAEDSGRVIVREKRSSAASVLSIDIFSVPAQLNPKALTESIIASIVEELSTANPGVIEETMGLDCDSEKKRCKQNVKVYSAQLEHMAGPAESCAFLLIPNRDKLLILALCTAQGRKLSPEPLEILKEVFSLMR